MRQKRKEGPTQIQSQCREPPSCCVSAYFRQLMPVPTIVENSHLSELTDATKSVMTGNGLKLATSGVQASFTVTARDESGTRRTSGGDNFIVQLSGSVSADFTSGVADQLNGVYAVTYLPTKSGIYDLGVKLARRKIWAHFSYQCSWWVASTVLRERVVLLHAGENFN
jgi:hypothetical protein